MANPSNILNVLLDEDVTLKRGAFKHRGRLRDAPPLPGKYSVVSSRSGSFTFDAASVIKIDIIGFERDSEIEIRIARKKP